ncbi:hypothetical protein QBC34DRAFT_223627 [Podospora aff. communis PSN243]|uniref:Uncharacterized protein n=1 Tax=Podospora aff. communis PSN243 TaxID=3040156 RepID=A0AAV9G6R5_9PEZI|nr:hypothetical protein QBC34DRAFT_223627 [Podospora aff. communis PSN243]
MKLSTILFSTLAAAAPQLEKRCRLGYGIMPCWVVWDHSECEAYIPNGVKYEFDEANLITTITGLCESCGRALAYDRDVRKWADSWAYTFGDVDDKGNGTFVIRHKDPWYMDFLQVLKPHPQEWATSCVHVEGDPEEEY